MVEGKKRRSISLTGDEMQMFDRAMEIYGKDTTGPKLIAKALEEKMNRIPHQNEIIRIHLVALADAAEEEGVDGDTVYVIKWMSTTIQKLITGRWPADVVRETIKRVEKTMKERTVEHHQNMIDNILGT